jgi:hypothetical protein
MYIIIIISVAFEKICVDLCTATSGVPASKRVIVAHPDFRMMVLANRPGFPFLGNDFFGAMGE